MRLIGCGRTLGECLVDKYTWVRYEARHGGGHQAHDVEYSVYSHKVDEDELEWMLEEWSEQFINVKSTAEIVPHPPHSIIKEMIDEHINRLKYSAEILTYCYKLLAEKTVL